METTMRMSLTFDTFGVANNEPARSRSVATSPAAPRQLERWPWQQSPERRETPVPPCGPNANRMARVSRRQLWVRFGHSLQSRRTTALPRRADIRSADVIVGVGPIGDMQISCFRGAEAGLFKRIREHAP
jgi:hypothetical protein